MTLHPHLSLVITQGTPRGALISGHIIYQAASFSYILCCTVQDQVFSHPSVNMAGEVPAEGPLQEINS